MANQIGLSAENQRTIERLRNLPKEFSGKKGGPVRVGLAKAATLIRNDARARAPIGTGTPLPGRLLRNVISSRLKHPEREPGRPAEVYIVRGRGGGTEGGRARRQVREGLIGAGFEGGAAMKTAAKFTEKDAYYWTFVEFGTAKMAARPFLRPAFEANKERAVGVFAEELKKAVVRIEKKTGTQPAPVDA